MTKLINTEFRLVDLRSENEFDKGTIPNSINIPILNNSDYAKVGKDYKKNGRRSAIQLGNNLISGEKKRNFINRLIQAIEKQKTTHIFCKRGGLRSSTAKNWLNEKNIEAQILKGGYKEYRKKVIKLHSSLDNYVGEWTIIGGYTGSGKTKLIKQLKSSIDLEGIAKHRGSTFGSTGEKQPNQQNFENILTKIYLESPPNLILENESRNIGGATLPGKFYDKMQLSKIVFIDETISDRVSNILEEYVLTPLKNGKSREKLNEDYQIALMKIRNRLGGDNYTLIKNELSMAFNSSSQSHDKWITLLLQRYYDKLYQHKLDTSKKDIVFSGDWNSCYHYLSKKESNLDNLD